jgi:hypothetical protein
MDDVIGWRGECPAKDVPCACDGRCCRGSHASFDDIIRCGLFCSVNHSTEGQDEETYVRVESGTIKLVRCGPISKHDTLCDRSRAEGHYLLVEEFFQLLAADVVLVHYKQDRSARALRHDIRLN